MAYGGSGRMLSEGELRISKPRGFAGDVGPTAPGNLFWEVPKAMWIWQQKLSPCLGPLRVCSLCWAGSGAAAVVVAVTGSDQKESLSHFMGENPALGHASLLCLPAWSGVAMCAAKPWTCSASPQCSARAGQPALPSKGFGSPLSGVGGSLGSLWSALAGLWY